MAHATNITDTRPQSTNPRDISNASGFDIIDLSGGDVTIDPPARGFTIGDVGDLKVDTMDDVGKVIPQEFLIVGYQYSCLIKKVYSAGTTATFVMVWY